MDCKEFLECACDYVDRRMSANMVEDFLHHAKACPHCKFELHALQASKTIAAKTFSRQSVPSEVYYAILNKTINEPIKVNFLQKLFPRFNPVIVTMFLVAVSVGIYSFFFTTQQKPGNSNFIDQSLSYYSAALGGSFKPELVSDHETVRTFLEKETHFAVNVPKVKKCKSYSGKCSDYKGMKLAHVNFQLNGNTIYIFQADLDEVLKGEKIGLPDEAKNALVKSNWYVKEISDNQTLVLWKYKHTICAAVSDMKKDNLVAILNEKEVQ
jgi:hypothetical protein